MRDMQSSTDESPLESPAWHGDTLRKTENVPSATLRGRCDGDCNVANYELSRAADRDLDDIYVYSSVHCKRMCTLNRWKNASTNSPRTRCSEYSSVTTASSCISAICSTTRKLRQASGCRRSPVQYVAAESPWYNLGKWYRGLKPGLPALGGNRLTSQRMAENELGASAIIGHLQPDWHRPLSE